MDGWGLRKQKKYNAVKLAKTLNYDYFLNNFQNCQLDASGEYVGLPKKQIGKGVKWVDTDQYFENYEVISFFIFSIGFPIF